MTLSFSIFPVWIFRFQYVYAWLLWFEESESSNFLTSRIAFEYYYKQGVFCFAGATLALKFGYSEKATKIWNNLPIDLTFTK